MSSNLPNNSNSFSSTSSAKAVKIGEAAKILGVSIDSLRRWEKSGKLTGFKTPGGTRFYDLSQLKSLDKNTLKYHQVIKPLNDSPFTSFSYPLNPKLEGATLTQAVDHINQMVSNLNQAVSNNNIHSASQTKAHENSNTDSLNSYLGFQKTNSQKLPSQPNSALPFRSTPQPVSESIINHELIKQDQTIFSQPILEVVEDKKGFNSSSSSGLKPKISTLVMISTLFVMILAGALLLSDKANPSSTNQLSQKLASLPSNIKRDLSTINPFKQVPQTSSLVLNQTASNDVLAASFSQSYLQINSDLNIQGSLAIDGDQALTGNLLVGGSGTFKGPVTAPNLITGLTPGDNISITGSANTPTISSTDTLASVTARGGTTTTDLTLNGKIILGNILTLGSLASDPDNPTDGDSYYNNTSNKFRCYQNGSWTDCINASSGSFNSFTLAASSGTNQTISDGDTVTIAQGDGISTTASSGGTVTVGLNLSTSGTTSTTSSNSGLETTSSGLSLIRGCSNNQLLEWNTGSSVWQCSNPVVGSISGSGSPGQLTYWDGTSDVTGSNNLFWDTATNRLGILTNTPANTFSVGASSEFQVSSAGAIAAATGITSSGTINFSGLSASSAIYTDGSSNLTTTAPTSGAIGYWTRTGTTLSPTTSGDSINTTSFYEINGDPVLQTTSFNTFVGINAGLNSGGDSNSFFGYNSGFSNTGFNNNFFGAQLAEANTGSSNNFIGQNIGDNNTGSFNNFIGSNIGGNNTSSFNNFIGYSSGFSNTSGDHNNFIGANAGKLNTLGFHNNFIGYNSGAANVDGTANNFIGEGAGQSSISASGNNFFGNLAGQNNIDGASNLFLGNNAGEANTSGSSNIFIGDHANSTTGIETNSIAIGTLATVTESFQMVIGSSNSPIIDTYIGQGVTAINPNGTTINTTGGSGTNNGGGTLALAGGKGTGSASGGDIIFETSAPGLSGTDLNPLSEIMRITSGGNVGIGDASPASLFTVGNGDPFQVNSSGNIAQIGGSAHTIVGDLISLNIDAATSGALNLNNTGTGDVNIAGGLGDTGCTVTNSTGDLTCTGNITGASTGAIGYWTRTGTTLSPTTSTDDVTIAGLLGVGDSGIDTQSLGYFSKDFSGTSLITGIHSNVYGNDNRDVTGLDTAGEADADSGITAVARGLISSGTNAGAGEVTNVIGGLLEGSNVSSSTGLVDNAYGVKSNVLNSGASSTITNAYGSYSQVNNSSTGTITSGYGLYVASALNPSGTFTNNYGLYLEDQSGVGSSNSYNIYSAGSSSKNLFEGTVNIQSLSASSAVYTDGSKNLTTTAPTTGSIGYWTRSGTTLSPTTSGDAVTTSGNIFTSGSGTITSAGLLTGSAGLTVTGGAISLSTSSTFGITTTTSAQTYTSSVASGTTTSSAFVFNASSLTSGTALYLTSSATSGKLLDLNATETSGTISNIAYGSSTSLSGSLIGQAINLSSTNLTATNQNVTGSSITVPTVTNTNSSGTKTLTGISIATGSGSGINQNGAGTTTFTGVDITIPALTQSSGTLNGYGVAVTTPATITTGGSSAGLFVNASGVGAGTLSGVNIGGITGGAGTEYALNIGTGWDAVLRVGSTTVINGSGVVQTTAGGTGLTSYTTGDIIYASGTNTLSALAGGAGNNGKVLTISSGVPVWGTVAGSSCTDCLLNDPSSTATNTILPTGDTTGLIVKQTATSTPTSDIFDITDSTGSTKYFYVDASGNVSTGAISNTTLTLTPTSNVTALTLVGTNVTSQPLEYINSKNSSATSGIVNLAYGAAQTLSGSVIGIREDLSTNITATNQSVTGTSITLPGATNTSGTQNYKGLVITGGAINENGGTLTNYIGADITIPALTQTSGTLNGYGVEVTTPSSITTGGTAAGLFVNASGVGAGTLYGLNVGGITAGAGSEYALNIGPGWDRDINFASTSPKVVVADGGTINFTDSAGNTLCSIVDTGTAGSFTCGSTGSNGYWSRSGTTISPATSNDIVSITSNSSTALLTLAPTGATGTGLAISALSGTTANTGINIGAISGSGATGTGITIGNISTTGATNYGIQLGILTGASTSNYQLSTGAVTAVASATNAQLSLGGVTGTAASSTNYGINIGNLDSTGTINTGLNIGNFSGATSSKGVLVGTMASATNIGYGVGAISGNTSNAAFSTSTITGGSVNNVGISIGAITSIAGANNIGSTVATITNVSSATAVGYNISGFSGPGTNTIGYKVGPNSSTSTTNEGIDIGNISGAGTTNEAINIGNISGATGNNYGIKIGTLTGGTGSSVYGINTGALTSVASGTNYQINLGSVAGASSATFGAINTGAISGAGTTSYGLNLGANSATATTNYGANIGAISGAGTTNYGLYVDSVTGASTNYAAYFAGGNVNIQSLSASAGVYTDSNKNLTSTVPSTGTVGYWTRSGTTLSPATSGDAVTTSGNISTTGSGTITSAGLLTGSAGLTISGGTANINVAGSSNTAIGNSSGSFALISTGLNVTTGGALTGVASLDTITTSATALTFAGAGSVAAGGSSNLALDAGTSGAVNIAGASTGDVNIAGGSGSTGCTITNASGNLACSGTITTTATSGQDGWWTRTGSSLAPSNSGDAITTSGNISTTGSGTITSAGLLTGSAGLTVTGGAVSLNASSNNNTSINTGNSTGAVSIGNSLAGAIAISTGSTFGVTTTTSSQTFTSSVVSTNTTSSGFVFTDNATLTGTEAYIGSTGVTTGTLLNIDTGAANTLTSGKLLSLTSSSTALTSGNLISSSFTGAGTTGFTGNLNFFDYSPSSASTTAPTGDIMRINLGANGSNLTGNLFNVVNNSTSLFSVSQSAVTSSIPTAFNAAGDVSIAYDVNLTNPTSSFIKSAAPITIQSGETFNSSNLSLKTFNQGTVVFDTGTTTGTAVDLTNTTLTTGKLLNIAPTFAGSAVTGYGLYLNGTDTSANANTDYDSYSTLALTGNAAKVGVGYYSTVSTSSTTADTLLAFDAATSTSGIITTGTRAVYGLRSQPASTGASTGGTTNVYGAYLKSGGTVGAGGTINSYGAYIANGTMSTTGTSANYGLYVETPTGADNNYGAIIAGGNVGIGTTAPTYGLSTLGSVSSAGGGVAAITNTNTTDSANTVTLRLNTGATNTTTNARFVTFYAGCTTENCAGSADGHINLNNNAVNYGTSGADYGERFYVNETTEPGDVIGIVGSDNKKAITGGELLGVVSDTAGFTGNDRDELDKATNPVIGLMGQVKTKVSTENGSIQRGDFLTSSSTPGVAMKAIHPGQVIGKALEDYPSTGASTELSRMSSGQYNIGKILVFVNVGFADPGNFLASLSFDDQGNLILPNIKTDKLTINEALDVTGTVNVNGTDLSSSSIQSTPTDQTQYTDLAGQVASLTDKVTQLENAIAALQNSQITLPNNLQATSSATIAEGSSSSVLAESTSSASPSSNIAESTASASPSADLALNEASSSGSLSLTPAETLFASSSATLTNLNVTNNISTLDLTTSQTFKSLGQTFLGQTTIAGDLSVDGTFSINNGDSINALPTLYIQNSSLASLVDFFNGNLTISKDGTLTANTISTNELRLATGQSVGSGKISFGQTSISIPSSLIKSNSHILITPTNNTTQTLAVTSKIAGQKFTVSLSSPAISDINFDWVIINEK